jgi:hypothetical protein
MAAALYPSFKKLLLDGDIDLLTDTIRVVLIDTGTYTFSAAHDFYADLTGVVGTESGALANKTTTAGVFDADNAVCPSVSGATVEAIVVFKDTGNPATDPLIAFIDGLTLTPDGNNVNVNFNASGIFAL